MMQPPTHDAVVNNVSGENITNRKRLGPLQIDILAVLDEWPSYEQATVAAPGRLGGWALPRDIIERLGLPKSAVTSVSVSRALAKLHERGLVARASGEVAIVGKAFRYLRITNPINAGAGNNGPLAVLGRKARSVTTPKSR